MTCDPIFQPGRVKHPTLKNRIMPMKRGRENTLPKAARWHFNDANNPGRYRRLPLN